MMGTALAPATPLPVHMETLTAKRRQLVEAIVWSGLKWKDAAASIRMSERRARDAMRDPTVKRAIAGEEQILRQGVRPRAIHRMTELSEQNENANAAVNAAKVLIVLDDANRPNINVNVGVQVGYVLDLTGPADEKAYQPSLPTPPAVTIDLEPEHHGTEVPVQSTNPSEDWFVPLPSRDDGTYFGGRSTPDRPPPSSSPVSPAPRRSMRRG